MTIRLKVTIGSIIGILVANGILSLLVVTHLQRVWLAEVQTRVRLDLNSARLAYDDHVGQMATFLQGAALNESLVAAATKTDRGQLTALLRQIAAARQTDFVAFVDARSQIALHAPQAQPHGDDLSQNPLISEVLRTRKAATGTLVVPIAAAAPDGPQTASQARVRAATSSTMIVAAAAPIVNAAGELQGILYGGELLAGRTDLVDRIRDAVFRSPGTDSDSLDTVTIFMGDLRIATNVLLDDGTRAIGTQMSREVADEVLVRGGTWAAPAFVVNDWYITAYEPIRDPQEKVVGALYVGLLQAPFLQRRNTLTAVVLIMVLSGTLACFLLILFIDYLVLRPAGKVIQMARRVMRGDLTARVRIRPPGELGILCQAIDHMAEALVQREQQLKLATSKQLGSSEKLASLGRLAAGVAHEINNPLTGVLTFAHLLREKPSMDAQDHEDLDLIIHETSRAAEIVRGLLDFARERSVAMEPLNINEVIVRTVRLVRNQKLFDRIVIHEELACDLPEIQGDMNQLQQVLLNLSLNACEAMPAGGTLTIRTRCENDRVVVRLTDTGCGIKEELYDRVFEPFFTTKPVGKGTGLGLSVTYGIVQTHGGVIELESAEGKGTTFTILLPAIDRGVLEETPQAVPRVHPFLANSSRAVPSGNTPPAS